MRILTGIAFCLVSRASAGTIGSFTGTLGSPEDVFQQTFTLSVTSNVVVETWGFGGGTNGAGTLISPGGFDPLVALFSGTGASATIVTDALGNPIAGADTLLSFTGNCPPAGTVIIGTGVGNSVCGDVFLEADGLAAGTYTLVLTDANYTPFAVNPGPPSSSLLSDGFADFTGGVFQTCNTTSDGTFCVTPTANFAVDIASVPEPGTLGFLTIGMVALFCRQSKKTRRNK
jgi:PEP-CTERM motif